MRRKIITVLASGALLLSTGWVLTGCAGKSDTRQDTRTEERTEERMENRR